MHLAAYKAPHPSLGYSHTIHERLAARVVVSPSGCWEWQGATTEFGYGRIGKGRRGDGWETTHRVAWKLAYGQIPEGMNVLHECDNPPCCNPSCLFLGTLMDNSQDMIAKGRGRAQRPRGEAHPDARLSDSQIAEMRRLYPTVRNYAALGRRFGVTKQHARNVVLGLRRVA